MKTVIYHANCMDGFAAATAAHESMPTARYYPVQYGQDFKKQEWFNNLVSGDKLFILDFSLAASILTQLAEAGIEIWLLDHHASAQQDLAPLVPHPGIHITFDMSHSGCVLAWQHFHPNTKIPRILEYVQDRDLWQWKLHFSKEVNAAISTVPFIFEEWTALLKKPTAPLVRAGTAILRYQAQLVDKACKNARVVAFPGHDPSILSVNAANLQSEIGNELLIRFPNQLVVCMYYHDLETGAIILSFRSNDDKSALEWARVFGGGGHPNAAGAKVAFLPGVMKL